VVPVNHLEFESSNRSLVDELSDPIAVFDGNLALIYSNRRYQTLFKQTAGSVKELLGRTPNTSISAILALLQQDGHFLGTVSNHLSNSGILRFKLTPMASNGRSRYVAVFQKEVPILVNSPSDHTSIDHLTDLPNRYAFLNALENRIHRAQGSADFAVLYVDLDHFKDINELHGHEVGDALLKLCAEKIRQLLRKDDFLARQSGDEFAAIVDCKESHEMQFLCHRIMRYFERPMLMKGERYQFTVSVGVVFYPEQGETAGDLLIRAEQAMFVAKKGGRAQFQLFDRNQSLKVEREQRIAESLRRVLAAAPEQFRAVYQPLFELQSGQFVGVEVLCRWHSPEFGDVSPVDFIGLAETRGLINALTCTMFDCITADVLLPYPRITDSRPLLAVNVSAQQVGDPVFESMLLTFLKDVQQGGWQLELELTESQLMTLSDDLISQLESWRMRGIRIAIDDFGTGYSCLAYLHTLPVDKLKVDRQFLHTKTESRKEDQILFAIMTMAKALEIDVLVEGIESDAQLARLQHLGCVTGQGFGLARPQPWHPDLMKSLNTPKT
jgi:diguanylate cyclase (GGDEF)-like protein